MSNQNYVYFEDAYVLDATPQALKVAIKGFGMWFPRSQLHDDCELEHVGNEGDLIIPAWLAEKKEIEPDGEYEP